MAKILLLDNYDSFTFNIAHLIREVSGEEVIVKRNDAISPDEALIFTHIVLSPGPGLPAEAGNMPEIVKTVSGKVPLLGVCLGHQCIGEAFGGRLKHLSTLVHGKATPIKVQNVKTLFSGIPNTFLAGRYHSWVIDKKDLPKELTITASDETGEIMAVEHASLPVFGVQFHPESVLTEFGSVIMQNFLKVSL